MKKIVFLFILLFITEGYCQEFFNAYHRDIIVINKQSDISYVDRSNEYFKDLIYEDKDYSVSLSSKKMFPPIPSKVFFLKRGEETMEVFCRGFGNVNYYIKNVEFKPGKYVLEYTMPKYNEFDASEKSTGYISLGKEIPVSIEFQDALFVNYLKRTLEKSERTDMLFKDMTFLVVDMNDVKFVKLIEVEKFPPW